MFDIVNDKGGVAPHSLIIFPIQSKIYTESLVL